MHLCLYSLSLDGIAWDWINEKLYWTDECDNVIEVYDPSSGHRKTLISTGTNTDPRGIVVDPGTRYKPYNYYTGRFT